MKIQNKKNRGKLAIYCLSAFFLIAFDQLTKWLAVLHLKDQDAVVLIPGVFELRYLENQSAAFGIDPVSVLHKIFHFTYFTAHPDAFLRCKMIFFVVMTILVVMIISVFFLRIPDFRHYIGLNWGLVIFVAGAIGNLIDRIYHNYVVDFFYFRWINFPIFNVADIYVTASAVGLMILGFFYYKEEDFELIFSSGKKDNND